MPKTLQPVTVVKSDYEELESYINDIFKEIYRMIIGQGKIILNSNSNLEDAIIEGKLIYSMDGFIGRFDKRTSKQLLEMGATWDRRQRKWKIPLSKLASSILVAIPQGVSANKQKIDALQQRLEFDELPFMQFEKAMKNIVKKFTRKLEDTIPTVDLKVTDEEKLIEKYSENMKLNVKGFVEEEVIRLREIVKENYSKGIRYDDMIKKIKDEFKVPVNKAKFLARQETHLLSAELKEQQYRKGGFMRYKWKTLNYPTGFNKKDVRPSHAALDGKVFDWDNPPVTDEKTGERNHPGQDFNCRCVALPILD